jgi:hypothetical protein
VKVCGVAVAMPQGHSWAPRLLSDLVVNVGTIRGRPPRRVANPVTGRLVVGCGLSDGAEAS